VNKTDLPLGANPKAINRLGLPHLGTHEMTFKGKRTKKGKGSLSLSNFSFL